MIYLYVLFILYFFNVLFFNVHLQWSFILLLYPEPPFEALCWQACCYQSARPCSLFNCREVPWKADSPSRKCTLSTLWSLCYHMFLLKLMIGWLFIFAGSSFSEVFTPIWKLYHILAFEAKNQSPFPFPGRIMLDISLISNWIIGYLLWKQSSWKTSVKYCLHPPAWPFRTKDSPSRNLPLEHDRIQGKKLGKIFGHFQESNNAKVDTHLACRSAWLTAGLDFIFLMLSWSAKDVTCSSVREVSKYSVIVLDITCSLNILSSTDSLATWWRWEGRPSYPRTRGREGVQHGSRQVLPSRWPSGDPEEEKSVRNEWLSFHGTVLYLYKKVRHEKF